VGTRLQISIQSSSQLPTSNHQSKHSSTLTHNPPRVSRRTVDTVTRLLGCGVDTTQSLPVHDAREGTAFADKANKGRPSEVHRSKARTRLPLRVMLERGVECMRTSKAINAVAKMLRAGATTGVPHVNESRMSTPDLLRQIYDTSHAIGFAFDMATQETDAQLVRQRLQHSTRLTVSTDVMQTPIMRAWCCMCAVRDARQVELKYRIVRTLVAGAFVESPGGALCAFVALATSMRKHAMSARVGHDIDLASRLEEQADDIGQHVDVLIQALPPTDQQFVLSSIAGDNFLRLAAESGCRKILFSAVVHDHLSSRWSGDFFKGPRPPHQQSSNPYSHRPACSVPRLHSPARAKGHVSVGRAVGHPVVELLVLAAAVAARGCAGQPLTAPVGGPLP
jgi:hypothetical protein